MAWQFGGDGTTPDADQVIIAGAGSQRCAQVILALVRGFSFAAGA
jgi:hypothetical protein